MDKFPTYKKWYSSHRKFSITCHCVIELFESENKISDKEFTSFLKSLKCHSLNEEKTIFAAIPNTEKFQEDHKLIKIKKYTDEEKYIFCKELLDHMKEEESVLFTFIQGSC